MMFMCAIALSRRAPRSKSSPSSALALLPSYAYFLSFLGLSSCCCTEAISLTTQRAFTSSSSSNFRWLSKQHHPVVGTFQYGLQQNNYQGFTDRRLKHGISSISSTRHGLFSSSSSSRTPASSLYSTTETEVTIQEIDNDDDASTTTTTAADTDTEDALTSFKKWEFINDNDGSSSPSPATQSSSSSMIRNLLVCGDGDLSYSAEISSELQTLGIELVATVLEEEDVHNQVYQYSKTNSDIISNKSGHQTMFGVDATTLQTYFGTTTHNDDGFDRIQFNFPHWRGKANNRYNRLLLNDFLQSAATVLSPGGEIHVALCDGQGGCSATTVVEWKGSWTASKFAGEHGLLLARVAPYEAQYNLSSHRGVDRPFKLGKTPKMYTFVKPNGIIAVPRDIQLCCRHELHIVIPDDDNANVVGGRGEMTICSLDQILAGDAIETIIQDTCVPDGVRVEVPSRQILEIHESHGSSRIAVFLIVYCSERYPVTRDMADSWRENVESEVEKYVPLRENRRGRTVSHPFPYPALHPEIKYHTSSESKQQ